jgi:hypothetical protein
VHWLKFNVIGDFFDDLVEVGSGLIEEGLVIENLRPLSIVELAEFLVHCEPKLYHTTHPCVLVVLLDPVRHFKGSVLENVQTLSRHFRYFEFLGSEILLCSIRIGRLDLSNLLFNLNQVF